ncbi:MAG: preprotein translocase subunit SecE [Patescibacteria group bacterium]|nr:preprotein translocase subunit SecE [Patescibacteria group bacterium]
MFKKISNYFKEAKQEFSHLNWPSREEAIRLTSVVIGFSLILAAFLGFFDYIFSAILQSLIVIH